MIVINAIIETNQDDIAALKNAIATMEAASRAEPGCHEYTFSVELNNTDKLRIIECWENVEALQAHFATEHMATFNAALTRYKPEGITLNCYEANTIPFPSMNER